MLNIFEGVNSFDELIDRLTPDIYQQLKTAVEIGKWPTGQLITQEQRALCMQAVIAYEQKNIAAEDRSGYVPPKKTPCGDDNNDEQILNLK